MGTFSSGVFLKRNIQFLQGPLCGGGGGGGLRLKIELVRLHIRLRVLLRVLIRVGRGDVRWKKGVSKGEQLSAKEIFFVLEGKSLDRGGLPASVQCRRGGFRCMGKAGRE